MDTMIMKMPAVALRGMVILPGMVAHFDVSRAKSIKAVEEAMMDEQKIFLVAQKDVEQENPDIEHLFKIGIIAEVKQVIKLQNNIVRILVEGKERAELSAFLENPDYLLAEIIRFDEEVDDGLPEEAKEAMLRSIQETFGKYVVVNPKMGKELQRQLSEITDLVTVTINDGTIDITARDDGVNAAGGTDQSGFGTFGDHFILENLPFQGL